MQDPLPRPVTSESAVRAPTRRAWQNQSWSILFVVIAKAGSIGVVERVSPDPMCTTSEAWLITTHPSGHDRRASSTFCIADHRAPQRKNRTVTLGAATITFGHDDDEADDASTDVAMREFGWDINEHPKRQVDVGEFEIKWHPVTNGEFYEYYIDVGRRRCRELIVRK